MSNSIPTAVADFQTQLATAISISDTSFTIASVIDRDGSTVPNGLYCFTIDAKNSAKEYLIGTLDNTTGVVSSVKTVSRQGDETAGAAKAHRIGASVIITDFATIQRVADALRGVNGLDADSPMFYDAEPALADPEQLATVGYVLEVATGGTVYFSNQLVQGTAGENLTANDVVYFKESDQRWWKADADLSATFSDVQLGIAQATQTVGNAVGIFRSGNISGFTGLTAGERYYLSNTAGGISTTPGTTEVFLGVAISTTAIIFAPKSIYQPSADEKDALAGGGDLGTPSTSNKFITEDGLTALVPPADVQEFSADGTWTKPDVGTIAFVEAWGAGGSGGKGGTANSSSGGGGGGGSYVTRWILMSALGATETVTVGTGGPAQSSTANGTAGENTTFGSFVTAYGGGAGGGSNSFSGGGGGAGISSAGSTGENASTRNGGAGGGPNGGTGGTGDTNPGSSGQSRDGFAGAGGGGGSSSGSNANGGAGGASVYGGGGGGAGAEDNGGAGGSSIYGGGGGGGAGATGDAGAGGSSAYGGAGGAGATGASNATAGTIPGGGGGGSETGSSGAGADGKVRVTVFY